MNCKIKKGKLLIFNIIIRIRIKLVYDKKKVFFNILRIEVPPKINLSSY